jgi:hypothetical protein
MHFVLLFHHLCLITSSLNFTTNKMCLNTIVVINYITFMLKILQEIFVELKESFINFNMILGKPLTALLLLLQPYMIFVLQGH